MDPKKFSALVAEAAEGVKYDTDLNSLLTHLKKIILETALDTELRLHLGYQKHHARSLSNARNGYTSKKIFSNSGTFELKVPS